MTILLFPMGPYRETIAMRMLVAFSLFMLAHTIPATPIFATEAGFAERDITPEIGMERPGGYQKNFHVKHHDPCKVRAAVFGDGTNRIALVGIDALMIRSPVVAAARKRITQECGIPSSAIMVGASHSHSAGPMGMIQPGEYDFASKFIQHLAYDESSLADSKYLDRVETAIFEAVCEADAKCKKLPCGVGRGKAEGISFNRRIRMRSGRTQTNPRQRHPEMIEPAGPVDSEVGVIGAWTANRELVGCVVNFACHCTTTPGGISADYVYYIEKAIRGMYGEQVIVVFLNGASGDITQQDNFSPFKLRTGEESSQLVGGSVGAEAIKVLASMPVGELTPIASSQNILSIARRKPSFAKVQSAMELAKKDRLSEDRTNWTFAKETVLISARAEESPVASVETQAIQIGPAVFLSNPAEYFCEFGLQIKKASPFPFTFPVSLANDCIGYVPTQEALSETGGGYETRLTSYSNLIPEAGDRIARSCIDMAKSLQPGSIPEWEPAPPYRDSEWTFGNVPAEID